MAEVLGIVASIIALLQLTGQVTVLGCQYIGKVKRASKEIMELVHELNSLEGVLFRLKSYMNENPESSTAQALDKLLGKCSEDLELLQRKLKPRKGVKGVVDKFKWPMKDNEMMEIKSRIERHKSLFLLSLSTDQMIISSKIERKEDKIYKEGKRVKVLDWLTKEGFDKKHTEIRNRRQEGTGGWLLREPKFMLWAKKKGYPLLWGHGIPGAGKTFLSSTVIDYLQNLAVPEDAPIGVAYIYFDYKEKEQQGPMYVLASLVKQLAGQLSSLPAGIEDLHDELERKRRRPTIDELRTILFATFKSFDGRVFLVFDALDECDQDKQRKELLPLFHDMATEYSISLFVTSRQYPEDIQESFHDSAKISLSANKDDIKMYIEHKISQNYRAKRLVQQANCKERIVSELIDCAQGMFLLVHFHIEHLCQQTNANQILSALEKLKRSSRDNNPLSPTYDRAMEALLSQPQNCANLGLTILSWLVKAKRTLKAEELRLAISVEKNRYELDELDLPNKATIPDVCAGLVIIDEETDTVRLAHYTVQEYLLSNSKVPEEDADFKTAMTCTTFLSFDIFSKEAPTPYFSTQKWIISHPFLRYAATHLSSHLNSCDENLTIDLVLRFIRSPNCVDNYLRFIMRHRGENSNQRLLMWDCRESPSQRLQHLHIASYLGQLKIVQLLLEQEVDPSIHEPGMWSPLHFAACEGWVEIVQLLLVHGADLSVLDRFGQTPLHIAVSEGHKAVVEVLLEKGADFTIKDFRGKTALNLAFKHGFIGIACVLLDRGAELETTELFDAVLYGWVSIIEMLPKSTDIATKNHQGDTALHLAVRKDHISLVQLLLHKGAKPSTLDKHGNTALHTAAFEGHEAMIKLLLEEDTEVEKTVLVSNEAGETALHYATIRGDEGSAQLLLDKGANHSASNNHGDTPLHNALSRGNYTIARLLLDKGTNSYDAPNSSGTTPLQIAASKGNKALVRFLLAKGANILGADDHGDTALSCAAAMGHKAVVQLQLEKGAKISLKNKRGNTALHQAALRGHEEVVQLLLENDVDVSAQNQDGDTALHQAASKGYLGVVKLLLNALDGVGWTVQNHRGDTALHQAASEGRYRVLEALLQTKPDLSIVNFSGSTPLHYAAWGGYKASTELLLQQGLGPSVQDIYGNTALHTAARRGNTVIVEVLLKNGVDFTAQNSRGDTALHYAAWNGDDSVIEILLGEGANPFVVNNHQNTPLHVAARCRNSAAVRILFKFLRAWMRKETVTQI